MTALLPWLASLPPRYDGAPQTTPRVPWAVLEWLRFDRWSCADSSVANDTCGWVAMRVAAEHVDRVRRS